jgi:hypothetical protein
MSSCFSDSECNTDAPYCKYNTELKKNQCINIDTMATSCVKESDIDSVRNIMEYSSNASSLQDCINFARSQSCNEGKCDYMVYKDAKETTIDITSIDAKISCNSLSNNMTEAINNAFTEILRGLCQNSSSSDKCSINTSNNEFKGLVVSLTNILKTLNGGSCPKYDITYSYKCQNSDQTATKTLNFTDNTINDISLNLTCPIDNNTSSGSVCLVGSSNQGNTGTSSSDCSYPVYNVPNYYSNNEINDILANQYKNEIQSIEKEMDEAKQTERRLKAERLMVDKHYKGDIDFTMEDAYNMLDKLEAEREESIAKQNQELYNSFSKKILQNLDIQQNDNNKIKNLENEKLVHNDGDLNNLDQEINTITNKIYKSQKTEELNVKVTYFLSLFLGIIFVIAVIVFIFIVVKQTGGKNVSNTLNNIANAMNNNY